MALFIPPALIPQLTFQKFPKPFKEPHWFQFISVKMMVLTVTLGDRVKAEGYKAIVLTADATVGGIVKWINEMALFFQLECQSWKNTS